MKTWRRLAAILLALAACSDRSAPSPFSDPLDQARQPIIDGSPANGQWPAVGALAYDDGYQWAQFCSATLIGPQWLLTAAHCADEQGLGFGASSISFFVGDDANLQSSGHAFEADAIYLHPSWDSQLLTNDIALVHLHTAVPSSIASPIAFNQSSLGSHQALTMVGYGVNLADGNGNGDGSGLKRYANGAISRVKLSTYDVPRNSSGQLVCFGDSGGPDLATLSGRQVVIGVHSAVDSAWCDGSGISSRVDHFAAWINGVVGEQHPNGHSCSARSDCQSNFCVGGFCCATACDGECRSCATGTCSALTGRNNQGQTCSDLNPCTLADTCVSGVCRGSNKDCGSASACTEGGTCDLLTGDCVAARLKPDGTSCKDSNPCTLDDRCRDGVCQAGSSTLSCPAPDPCHLASTCNPETGQCHPFAAVANGTPCDDDDPCTQGETCLGGRCLASTLLSCPAPDSCHEPGTCDSQTGQCPTTYPQKSDGAGCDDRNACTDRDRCQGGTCRGTPEAGICPADACHDEGQCDPQTGRCSGVNKPEGAVCDDLDPATEDDQCRQGTCLGLPPARAQCAGKPEATDCDDGDACTRSDFCLGGACRGTNPKLCRAPTTCQEAGACDRQTGDCDYPSKADGLPCDTGDPALPNGECQDGTCVGSPVATGETAGSCGCSAVGAGPAFFPLWIAALSLSLRRRRRP